MRVVPGSRLLLLTLVAGLPFATVATALPALAPVAWAALAVLAAAAVGDLLVSLGRLDTVDAELPPVARLTKDREGAVQVTVRQRRPRALSLAVGLPLPASFDLPDEAVATRLEASVEQAVVPWPCTPRRRGRFPMDAVYLEAPSVLGLWAVRRRCPVEGEVRVYPNLLEERRHLAALFLNRGGLGIHAQRRVGQGREFEQLRDYIAGDSFEDIHWKATAKRRAPITKVYQVERTQEVYVVIDASRLSARRAPLPGSPGAEVSQLERFITSALVLGMAAEQQGDHFGLLVFSDRVERFVRASSGKAHFSACRDSLYTLQPRIATPDFEELATFIRLRMRRRALLVFLTNLDDPVLAENFEHSLQLVSRQHLVLVNMLAPPGVRPVFSGPPPDHVRDVYDALAGHLRWQGLREVERVLHRRGVTFSLVDNAKLVVDLVTQYVNVKQRQAL
jgi:uncharacterized protein (DUF58 family)